METKNEVVKEVLTNEKKSTKKGKKKLVLIIIFIIALILALLFIYFINNKPAKKKSKIIITTTKKEQRNWITPSGTAGTIDFYYNELNNYIYGYKPEDVIGKDYLLQNSTKLGTYNCTNANCKVMEEISLSTYKIVYDGQYYYYDIKNNKSKKLNLSYDSAYNEMSVINNDDNIIGIYVCKNNNIFAIYDEQKERFVTDFIYSQVDINPEITNQGYILVTKQSDTSTDKSINNDSILLDYKNNYKPVFEVKNAYLSLISNNDFVYYKSYIMAESKAVIYNSKFKKILNGDEYNLTGISEKGNIAVSNNGDTTFSVYNDNGTLIKKSKVYNNVEVISNDYVVVIDTDNYLKIVDYDGNVVAKFIEMTDNYKLHYLLSGWYTTDNKNGIYVVVENKNIEYGTKGSGLEYYYIPSTKEKGVIETEGVGDYAKPILYLYPKKNNTKINISFENGNLLTTTYPKYNGSWTVMANKNGDLHDLQGKYYYGLYWEEEGSSKVDFKTGFYVEKNDAAKFLEDKLTTIGLNEKEKNEFIVYWLPLLEKNEKSLVYFELTSERQAYNKLIINPTPDSLLRVAIHVKKVNNKTSIKEEQLTTFKRIGFTAVEWGGVIH